jgi:hypothetical protein
MWRQGNKGVVLAAIFLALLGGGAPGHSAPAAPLEIQTVEGRGAILRGGQAAARRRALMTSLRQAVEITVAELLDANIRVAHLRQLERQLYQHAPQYIRSYRVLWEYPDLVNQVYRIAVEAETDVVHINRALVRLGMAPAGVVPLRLLVLIAPSQAGEPDVSLAQPATHVLTQALRQRMAASRVTVIDSASGADWKGDDTSALSSGRAAGADVVLVGQANLRSVRDDVAGMALHTVQAMAHLRLLVTETGVLLTSERASETVDHRDRVLAGQQALERVAATLVARVMPVLQAYEPQHASR